MDVQHAHDTIVFHLTLSRTEFNAMKKEVNEYESDEEGPAYPASMDLAHKVVRSR